MKNKDEKEEFSHEFVPVYANVGRLCMYYELSLLTNGIKIKTKTISALESLLKTCL